MSLIDAGTPNTEAHGTDARNEDSGERRSRRNLVTALMGIAGLGVASALGKATSPREVITPDPTPRSKEKPGDNSLALSGTTMAWVTCIGTSANTTTDINLRGMEPGVMPTPAELRLVVALGFWSEADGGGGVFWWDMNVGTDDGGTVIVPSTGDSPTGCWRRIFSGPLDVRWFGCKCDGTSNDTAAFTVALAAVHAGVELIIPGLMRVGYTGWPGFKIQAESDFSIVGLNPRCGFKVDYQPSQRAFGTNAPVPLMLSYCTRAQIRGILIDGNDGYITLLGFQHVEQSLVADCVFRNTHLESADVYAAIFAAQGDRNIFRGNRIESCTNGFVLGNPGGVAGLPENNVLVTENVIVGCTDSAIFYHGNHGMFSNNVITLNNVGFNLFWGTDSENVVHSVNDVMISGNVISGNAGSAIRFDPDGTVLNQDWMITNNLIEGNGETENVNGSGGWISIAFVANLTIAGNVIKNNGTTQDLPAIMISECKNATISHNVITDDRSPPRQGPAIRLSYNLDGVAVTGNTISNPGPHLPPYVGERGIGIEINTQDVAQNLTITGNVFNDCGYVGLWDVSGVQGLVVSANQFHNCRCGAAFNPGGKDIVVTGNLFRKYQYGIGVATDTVRLSGNVFSEREAGTTYDIFSGSMPSDAVIYVNGDAYDEAHTIMPSNSYIVSGTGTQKQMRDDHPPDTSGDTTSVNWKVGDIVYNTTPGASSPDNVIGWVCTTAGHGGTGSGCAVWKGFGTVL